MDRFTASDLWTECLGSDHCPVWADLDVPTLHLPQGFLPPALSTSHTFAGLLLNQSINQSTFYVFGTHQGSQQTITGKTVYTKH